MTPEPMFAMAAGEAPASGVPRPNSSESDRPEPSFETLYAELHRLAGRVRRGRASETMSTTVLVHETYVKLASVDAADVDSRLHFFRLAARAMRQVLVDAARQKLSAKRGGDLLRVTLDESAHSAPMSAEAFLSLDEAIQGLTSLDPRAAEVVECRFFAGLTTEETASMLCVSPRTVKRDWRVARAFLAAELAPPVQ
jgi:RNA polymerase sigma factor (TIGR02999 family)